MKWSTQTFEGIIERLVRNIERVPEDVPAGLHLCYGDYQHQHFKQPESLDLQVRVSNAVASQAARPVNWIAFTVPQNRQDENYFEPLSRPALPSETEIYLALVPYHPTQQAPGTTEEQVRLVDHNLTATEWGICTECGMAEPNETMCRHSSTCTGRS